MAIVGAAVVAAAWLSVTEPFILPTDLPSGMPTTAPQRCVGIFLVCMALWFTNMVPPAATALLAIALLPLLSVLPKAEAFALFGNSAVFFMLGVFLLAGAMISTGLSKRITLLALQRFDGSPQRLVTGVILSAAFLSLWMPAHGVAAMVYPIVYEIVDALQLKRGANYAKKLFLGLAWGAIIGSCGTILGGARAPLALSLLHEAHPNTSISFLGWMLASMPVVIVMTFVAVITIRRRIPDDITDIKAATRMLDTRVRHLGPMSPRERRLTAICLMTIAAWILIGDRVGLAVIAMLAVVILFLVRVVDWKSVQDYVNWGVLIMYGGAVALGAALTETKAMAWLAGQVIDPTTPALLVILLIAVATILLTEAVSNAAAVAILLPIGYSLGEMIGIGPVMITMAVTVPAGLAFLFPISSPPNAISFSAGHYSLREVLQIGWPMTAMALVTLLIVITVWWGMILDIGSW